MSTTVRPQPTYGVVDDYIPTYGAADFWATSMLKSGLKAGAPHPQVNLTELITAIKPEAHIKGTNAIEVDIYDEGWQLLDSGFLASDADPALLTPLDVNWPPGGRFWWRLAQCSPQADYTMTLTFYDRIIVALQAMTGPIAGERLKMTRAEFFKYLCELTNKEQLPPGQGIEFYCRQLDKIQPIDPANLSSLDPSTKKQNGQKLLGVGGLFIPTQAELATNDGTAASPSPPTSAPAQHSPPPGTNQQSPPYSNHPLPSKDYGAAREGGIKLIVLCSAEFPYAEGLETITNPTADVTKLEDPTWALSGLWHQLDDANQSAHIGINGDGTTWKFMNERFIPHYVANYNNQSVVIQNIGYATPGDSNSPVADWPWMPAQLDMAAQWIGYWSVVFQIPITHSTTNGVCMASDLGAAGGSRAGMGTDYQFSEVLAAARAYAASQPPIPSYPSSSSTSTPNTGNSASFQVKGRWATKSQAKVLNLILNVANRLNAGAVATEALVYAAIGETSLGDDKTTYQQNQYGAIGVFQGTDPYWHSHPHDIAGQATCFLLGPSAPAPYSGGLGFHFGAISLAQGTAYPTDPYTSTGPNQPTHGVPITDPIQIAVYVEDPSIWPKNAYESEAPQMKNINEVKAIVQKAGGSMLDTYDDIRNYTFTIGTSQLPHEDYWTGMNRLADAVAWRLFANGNWLYFDSDRTLITQVPAAYIHRNDAIVADWHYDWENRKIATNMSLTLFADAFTLRPGDVVVLDGFGPASKCSTCKPQPMPGRWLITDIQPADVGEPSREFTLAQPVMPKNEPRGQTPASNIPAGSGGVVGTIMNAAAQLSQWSPTFGGAGTKPDGYQYGGGHSQGQLDDVRKNATHGLDCSGSVCWCLKQGGLFDADTAVDTVALGNYGKAGPGQAMTMWVRPFAGQSGHVFLEFNLAGSPHSSLNTETTPWFSKWGGISALQGKPNNGLGYIARHFDGT